MIRLVARRDPIMAMMQRGQNSQNFLLFVVHHSPTKVSHKSLEACFRESLMWLPADRASCERMNSGSLRFPLRHEMISKAIPSYVTSATDRR